MSEHDSTLTLKGMEKSYDEHSKIQLSAIQSSSNYIQRAIEAFYGSDDRLMIIADFGCSHGSNSIKAIELIIELVKTNKKIDEEKQEILVVHNDLPTNDWNLVFGNLSKTNKYYGLASGRSFYDQCLPNSSLSIGYSSTCLHWLSSKPCNLTDRCLVDRNRNDEQTNLFKKQSFDDYDRFLECRSKELITGGVLILSIIADQSKEDTNKHGDLLYSCAKMILDEQECLDYTFPMFFRTHQEIVDKDLFVKHHLELINEQLFSIKTPSYHQLKSGQITLDQYAKDETMAVRSACEFPLKQSLIKNQRRNSEEIEQILDQYWKLHEEGIKKQPDLIEQDLTFVNVVLRKIKI